ncbi:MULTISPECIES: aromatic ring-hydroxylating oxygenase subunit alpha [unclassified Rhodococcus (in: high G+C Gram-positive bacteria)]|uniref:Alpha subunit of buprofezin dioxygenase n=1 Tax=Rhodococcus qingshengii TaxID=334542 RepID=A0A221J3D8_RHOSG|nr:MULTISPECIES: Rieske 2Fe-2S domain-containing protein [unclassified Rhodococcus (in: high G+C Gram-positive bacteria)]ASM60826.1 alpha subunit of buprofezin dioxygenase [Rhodococcus qingshengii]
MPIDQDEIQALVSVETGEIDRRIFTDQAIFDREMREIFGRAWLFLCHESQIPKSGDFFEAPMGRDNVLVVRQKDGTIRAMLNTCTHRGNSVCRAEEGNTKNFMCTYHGWTFGIDGELVGVPQLESFYKNDLDLSKHGLRHVAQLDTYKGFVFATFDAEAPTLIDFLGSTGRLGIDLIAEMGDMEIVPGVGKFEIDCNWKLCVDNLFDWYHPQITHMSATYANLPVEVDDAFLEQARDAGGARTPDGTEIEFSSSDVLDFPDMIGVFGEYGHAIAGPPADPQKLAQQWRNRPEAIEALGPLGIRIGGHPGIFPTMWITEIGQVSLRVPRSPTLTEIWWFNFVPKEAPAEVRSFMIEVQNHLFGPAGVLEQEDGENWAQGTMHAAADQSATIPHLLKMNLGRGKIIREGGLARIEDATNEHAQLWTYKAWAQWMSGSSWEALAEGTTPGDTL